MAENAKRRDLDLPVVQPNTHLLRSVHADARRPTQHARTTAASDATMIIARVVLLPVAASALLAAAPATRRPATALSARTNYYNTLSQADKLNQLGRCRFMDRREFDDGIAAIDGKKVVIIGCGAQGLNQGPRCSAERSF